MRTGRGQRGIANSAVGPARGGGSLVTDVMVAALRHWPQNNHRPAISVCAKPRKTDFLVVAFLQAHTPCGQWIQVDD